MIGYEQIVLALLWVALMLIFLLGDVLRIFAGDFTPGKMGEDEVKPSMWVVAALMMVVPILMIVVSLFVPIGISKWITIVASVLFFLLNLSGLKGYKLYDQILLVISFVINFITIYYVWGL